MSSINIPSRAMHGTIDQDMMSVCRYSAPLQVSLSHPPPSFLLQGGKVLAGYRYILPRKPLPSPLHLLHSVRCWCCKFPGFLYTYSINQSLTLLLLPAAYWYKQSARHQILPDVQSFYPMFHAAPESPLSCRSGYK